MTRRVLLGLGVVLAGSSLTSRGLGLYTGLTPTTPNQQGWLMYGADAFVTQIPPVFVDYSNTSGGGTTLATTDAHRAGFSNYSLLTNNLVNTAFPTLDRTTGFDVRVDGLVLNSEQHNAAGDRAGFSVIAISSAADHKGIEIGFHANEVISQNDGASLFVGQGEVGSVDMTHARNIDLRVTSSGYQLLVDGSLVLSGGLRDYSAFVPTPPLTVNPYILPSYLFFGDDTTSAGASAAFTNIAVTVPEPAALTLAVFMATAMTPRRRRSKSRLQAV